MISRRQSLVAGSAAVLVAGLGLAMWLLWPTSKLPPAADAAPTSTADAPSVSVAQVKAVRLAPQASFPGTVMSRNDSKLAADVAGRVEWVAEVGTALKQGDVVARLDKHMLEMQRTSDRANVDRLSAIVRFDRIHADRMDQLLAKNVVAKTVRDQAISTRDSDVAALPFPSTHQPEWRMALLHSTKISKPAGSVSRPSSS